MYAFKAKIPVFCGYAVMLAAMALMGYTAACAPRPEEQWNSYYYGTTPQYSNDIMYYGGKDVDSDYSLPADMDMPYGDRNLQEETVLHGNRLR